MDNNTAFVGRLEPNSVFGLFVRRVVLMAELDMFSALARLYDAVLEYREDEWTAPKGPVLGMRISILPLLFW